MPSLPGDVHQLPDATPEATFVVADRAESAWTGRPRSHDNEQARAILESIGDSVITTDVAGRITYLNPVAERLTGWPREAARGQPLSAVLALISEVDRRPLEDTAARCLKEGRSIDLADGVLLRRRDGTEVPVGDSAAPVRNRHGAIVGAVVVIQDESEKRRVGHRLSFEATHDALTGLINRGEFERRLTRALADSMRTGAEHVLLYLDLDRFKAVNDTGGHDTGDALLRSLGPLMSNHLRKRDTMARLGGDEFGVLLENCPLVDAKRIAEALREEIEEFRFERFGRNFAVGVSIGLTQVTGQDGGIDAVLRAADAACYAAKAQGGNRVHLGQSGRDPGDRVPAKGRPASGLSRAVEEGLFQLYVQPIVPLQPDLPARPRFEVLLRLPNRHGQLEAAADFLPRADRASLMPAIDRWVVQATIARLSQWYHEHRTAELPLYSINLGVSAIADDTLVPVLEHALTRFAVPAEMFCFEIAEAAVLTDLSRTIRLLSELRTIGCGTALEDFGSSLTSFTYLKTLPVDHVKIGGHFIREVVADATSRCIVVAVDQVVRSMGIFTIAKQVGSAAVLQQVRSLGIGYAQGRALAHPVPMTDGDQRVTLPTFQHAAWQHSAPGAFRGRAARRWRSGQAQAGVPAAIDAT